MLLGVSAAVNGPAAVVVWTLPAALGREGGLVDYRGLCAWSVLDGDAFCESMGDFEAVGASCG
jgi:hypothetical protein